MRKQHLAEFTAQLYAVGQKRCLYVAQRQALQVINIRIIAFQRNQRRLQRHNRVTQLFRQLGTAAIAACARIGGAARSQNNSVCLVHAVDRTHAVHMAFLDHDINNLGVGLQLAAGLGINPHQRINYILRLVTYRKNTAAAFNLRRQSVTLQQQYYIII